MQHEQAKAGRAIGDDVLKTANLIALAALLLSSAAFADHYREVARVPGMAGAKTAIVDADHNHLWLAASPGESGAIGKVLRFDVAPR